MELLSSLVSSLRTADPRTLEQEFKAVRSQTAAFKKEPGMEAKAGALKENIKKNRYRDILPYDQCRVVLSPITNCDSDYINASFIKGASPGRSYIASQAPLRSTLTDFWRMIWQHDVKVIVMACREVEMGKAKCECYWAPVQKSAAFGPFTVHNQGETRPTQDLVLRTLSVTFQQESRLLVQYQFVSWFDHDVPSEAAGVLDLLQRARTSQGTHTSPLLVHCSAGCGRTGVICVLDYIHDLLVTENITADFSVMEIVLQLRRQRPSTVQTKEQYQFIFSAVALMLERLLQSKDGQLRSDLSTQLTRAEERTRTASTSKRQSQGDMSDTYAVVNKAKHPLLPSDTLSYPTVSKSTSGGINRAPPATHHYDNESTGSPIYSTVKPKAKRSTPTPPTHVAAAANHSPGEGPPSPVSGSAELHPSMDDDYEDFSSSVAGSSSLCSPSGIGFNCRVQRPRGPRDPPAEWSRLER